MTERDLERRAQRRLAVLRQPGWISASAGLSAVPGFGALAREPRQPGGLLRAQRRLSLSAPEKAKVVPWRLVRLLSR
jgi:hypothetical protein